jgi:hypothetical protein
VPDPEPCPDPCPVVLIKVKVHPCLDLSFCWFSTKKPASELANLSTASKIN